MKYLFWVYNAAGWVIGFVYAQSLADAYFIAANKYTGSIEVQHPFDPIHLGM